VKALDAAEAREAEQQLAAFERACDVIALGDEVLRALARDFPKNPYARWTRFIWRRWSCSTASSAGSR